MVRHSYYDGLHYFILLIHTIFNASSKINNKNILKNNWIDIQEI